MDIKPYNNYARNNYRETYQQAQQYKHRFEKSNDPILQRDPTYVHTSIYISIYIYITVINIASSSINPSSKTRNN
jgi:hypothetical protein